MTTMDQWDWSAIDEFLADERLAVRTRDIAANPSKQRLSAVCYVEHDGRVLMLRRRKEPFAGFWTAPGGKLLPGEDPREAVLREVHEETQLLLQTPELRMITSETGPEHYNWLLFFFRARPDVDFASQSLLNGSRETAEGLLDWLPIEGLADQAIPSVERDLLPYVVADPGSHPYFARIQFASDKNIAEMSVRPLTRD